ncbi:MAG: hypothetical protein E7556_03445 [Ruminococcaceae bacterium]|nr:hypothetical protein [Oscillospiraceae bacterium]
MVKNKKAKNTKIAIIIFVIAAIVATIFTTVLAFGKTNEGYRTITVIEIQGTVGVVHDDIEYQAYTGMHLEEGYTVVTGGNSYIRMLLDDDKYVKLESGSKANFTELSTGKTTIKIERGSLVSEITKPLAVDEDFIVNTPNAVLAVRGTLFRVDLSRNEKGELNTDVMTYGGAVSSKRVQPNGDVEDIEVTIKEGFKATVNMDDKETVYLVDEVKIDLSALVGGNGSNVNNDTTITETNASGEIINITPVTLESVLKPIVIEDIPDDDLVDIYFASENGHQMFVETEQIETHIEERNIDVTTKTSVYEVAEKIENPVEIVIPDDNVPLATTTEAEVKEQSVMVQGPPTDGLGTVHTHNEVTEEVKPTCTKDGKTIVRCSDCGETISETIISALGHTVVGTVTTKPTCKGAGLRTDSCSVCGEVIAETVLASTGHTAKTVTAKPTCTMSGKTVVSCTVCGEKISETVNNATGHKEIFGGTKDSHTECETCRVVLSKSHTFKEIVTEPTCTTDGVKTYICECGYIYEEKITSLGHTTETKTVEPTCTKTGKTTVSCSVCEEIISETEIEKLPHTEKTTTVEPTCTETGKTTVSCSVCEEIISETEIPKIEHTAETTTVEPTCTEDGSETTVCTVCGEELYYTVLGKTGHTEEVTTVEPTCTENGSKTTKCSVCDETLSTAVLAKTGHTENVTTVNPTCTETGKTTVTCTVCDEVISETVLSATGHTEINGGTDAVHTKCSVCDLPLETEHELQETVNQKENCTTDGLYTYSCDCGYEYTETVSKTGHTEADGNESDVHKKCSVCGETLEDGTYHNYTETVTTPNSCTTEGLLTYSCECGWSYTEPVPASHTKSTDGLSCSACGGEWLDLNSSNFPDSMFLSYIKTNFNTDPYAIDEALIGDELTTVTTINIAGDSQTDGGYTDLTGIENFVNLTNINCSYNSNIETLDLSGLTSLTNLDITGLTGLKTLNISGCTNLTEDRITGLDTCTSLTDLNVSGCVNLAELNLNSNTKVENVNLSNCTALTSFVINDNSTTYELQSIDLTGCSALETLTINNALSLTTVDFTDLTALKTVDLGGCQGVTGALDVSNKTALTSFSIGGLDKVTSLKLTGCTAITEVNTLACAGLSTIVGLPDCSSVTTLMLKGTAITSLDLNSSNPVLQSLNVENCTSLTNLDLMRSTESTTLNSLSVIGCTALKTLNLYNCKGITTLDTTTLTALEELNLTYSGVTEFNSGTDTMDFAENVNLKNVYLNGITSFTSFDVSANTLLEEFALTENTNVTSLDFSNSANLKVLNLSDVSSLNALDISSCTSIESLNLLNTGLTTLSVTGSDALTQFWVYNNTRLTNLSLTGATSLTSVKLSAGSNNATLTSLTLSNNGITSLDVTYLTQLSTLDVSDCSALETITGMSTAITNLNVTGCTALTSLDLTGCTALSTITGLDTCTSLNNLNVSATDGLGIDLSMLSGSLTQYTAQNATMTSIDLSGCAVLATLDVSGCTNLTTLNVTNCTSLTSIIGLDTLVALENLVATGSGLTNIDASLLTNLSTIDVDNMSNLESLNISNTKVTILDVSTLTELSALEAKKCTALTSLTLTDSNTFTDLDISDCTNITEIDVSTCTSLVNLNVSGTAIIALEANQSLYMETVDASDCALLEGLVMDQTSNNNLISVDVSGCTSMMCLQISNSNSLQELNLAGLTSLTAAYIDNCTAITSIDISNTRMSDISSLNIPSLTNFKTLKASDAALSDSELAGMLKDTLEVIDISDNSSVTTIDLSGFENLKTLDVSNSGITGLDTSYCLNLETVDAGDCTQLDYFIMSTGTGSEYNGLTSVNISGCTSMTMIHLSDAPNLEEFNLSGLANLTEVYVQNCPKITSLDLSDATNISLINVVDSGLRSGSVALPAGKDESMITGLS